MLVCEVRDELGQRNEASNLLVGVDMQNLTSRLVNERPFPTMFRLRYFGSHCLFSIFSANNIT